MLAQKMASGGEVPCLVPCSICLSGNFPGPPEDTYSQQLPLHKGEEEQWKVSLCSSSRYHLRTSLEHDYWRQNNTDRISHARFGYGANKDRGTQPLSLSPSLPHNPLLLFRFQLLIGRHLICISISFSEHTWPPETP